MWGEEWPASRGHTLAETRKAEQVTSRMESLKLPGRRQVPGGGAVIGNRNLSPGMAKEDGIVDHESSVEIFFYGFGD